jgi:hypothetical protein
MVHINALEDFSGAPIDWESWSVKTSATLGQTAYRGLLTAPTPVNVIAVTRDRELFHMLKAATYSGTTYHVVESNAAGQSGHTVITALTTCYGRSEVSRTIIDHYRTKIQALLLNEQTTGTAFINEFIFVLTSSRTRVKATLRQRSSKSS